MENNLHLNNFDNLKMITGFQKNVHLFVRHVGYFPEIILSSFKEKRKTIKRILSDISINLLVVYRESVNLIGYITRRLSADSHQL